MLHLQSFIHRADLAEIISRWMVDHPGEGDVRRIKEVVNFNSYLARIWVDQVGRRLIHRLHGAEPRRELTTTKGEVKDFVVAHPTTTSARIEALRAQYRRFPEDYYRETPIDGGMYVLDGSDGPRLAGTFRIKRYRRIAEKGSRRIVDFMLARIRASADALAEERATQLGVPRSQLYTPPSAMVDEFRHAERRVIKSIKQGTIRPELPLLDIPDVVGLKLIGDEQDYARLLDVLAADPACRVVETERHSGLYNAVNVRVAYTLPKALLLEHPPAGRFQHVLAFRGFDRATLARDYRRFVETGEDEVQLEIIFSSFEEYLESEIGRCMHEDRVLSQRSHPDYNGHLATNIRYLMDYILDLCRGPGLGDLESVPIKLWVRYMPDTVEAVMRGLYPSDDMFFDAMPEVDPADPPEAA